MIYGACPKCNSSNIYFRKEGASTTSDKERADESGSASYTDSDMLSYVCTACGYFENYIANRDVLAQIARQWQKVGASVGADGLSQRQADDIVAWILALQKALADGPQAPGKILKYQPMGFVVNEGNPVATLELEVQPPDAPAFIAQTQGVIIAASVPKYQPGHMVTVRYNPAHPGRVALVRSGV